MKIAVASDNGIMLTGHVGRCSMFLVYDICDRAIQSVEKRYNNFTMHKQGDTSHNHEHEHDHNHEHKHNHDHGLNHSEHNDRHAGVLNGLKDCEYLLCSSAGPGLISDLVKNKIEVILTNEIEAESAIKQFLLGTLVNDPTKQCTEHRH